MATRRQAIGLLVAAPAAFPAEAGIEIWHGEEQRTGHLGDAQEDFNLLGHVAKWRDVDRLTWRVGRTPEIPLSFRAFRRLVADGDFNADIPIGRLQPGPNTVTVTAYGRDGTTQSRSIVVRRESGASRLPIRIRWAQTRRLQDVGQVVDGRWEITPEGLRTRQTGYDRLFLIGQRDWTDYEVRTSVTVHSLDRETAPVSGGPGVGIILRFTGHVSGGPRHFPSGQPKWGYQPFGAIGWLRWPKSVPNALPHLQFYPGDSDRGVNHGEFDFRVNRTFNLLAGCRTLAARGDRGVTSYRMKAWPSGTPEPPRWNWEEELASPSALRMGGVALVAHHVDVTFGDVAIQEIS